MKRVVYYGFNRGQESNELLGIEPDPLSKEIKAQFKANGTGAFLRCYAFQEQVKNTFIFRAPLDLTVKYTGDEREFVLENMTVSQDEFDSIICKSSLNDETGLSLELLQVFVGFGLFLFTDKTLKFSLLPAFYHRTGASHLPIVTGTFDCARWFRPINMAVINRNYEDFHIKRGDPLFYLKFHTEDTVSLQRMAVTEEMQKIANGSVNLQRFLKKTPLADLYNFFTKSGINKKLMREIKNQR